MFAYLLHELVCVCICVQICGCVCLLHNRLAPMWGSKSIIPAAFTYHFTELYVQCKQRLSLHANEPVSHSLHKDPIHCQHGVLPARWIRYPRLQVYSQALGAALLSLTLYNSSLQMSVGLSKCKMFTNSLCIIRVMTNTSAHKCHVSDLTGLLWT